MDDPTTGTYPIEDVSATPLETMGSERQGEPCKCRWYHA